ncbi:MAG: L-2-hydroxyglutarate oxidase [Flavobacteriaceae bacterium]|nr:L-2-hydroxyglutarate oxidase [Flavobacteriaceae bacterium]|tara:strand:+ start:30522 stop:31709 length:1188 start_codon:yes stop_codon:yes gene_type:complete
MKYDFAIVGAGIVGLSTALSLKKKFPKSNIIVIEKEETFSKHQSGNNSNVIHSGIYYKPGSSKALNCKKGYDLLLKFLKKYNIPHDICGKLIVASSDDEINELIKLYKKGIKNGLKGLKILEPNEIKKYEPHVNGLKAIHVPQAGITDYKLVSKKIYELLKENGVMFSFNTKVTNIINKTDSNTLVTNSLVEIKGKYVINVAGLYSDKLAKINFKIDYKIIPFRGEYYNLKSSASYLVKNLIYPVPNPDFPFLGVHFTRRINNSIESGPNAVFAFSREGYKMSIINLRELFESISYIGFLKLIKLYWKEGINEMYRSFSKQAYLRSLQKLIPEIKISDISSGGAGVRAQAVKSNGEMVDDFLIISKNNIINVCNAPSPAATASFAIGEHITNLIK